MGHAEPFSEEDLRAAIAQGLCWADALRYLGYEAKGHNYRTIKKWAARWDVATGHFDPRARTSRAARTREAPINELLVENSDYQRGSLKRRLLREGIKQPICELCGQDELWLGNRMSMILDHINGVPNDNRLENLRMLCPNCNATLATHCGRNTPRERVCPGCQQVFIPSSIQHRYCSTQCWGTIYSNRKKGVPQPWLRRVERPPYGRLVGDLAQMSMVKVGAKYGVSDNAVRKWLRWYEADIAKRVRDSLTGGQPREIRV
jgi:hypothetical protein